MIVLNVVDQISNSTSSSMGFVSVAKRVLDHRAHQLENKRLIVKKHYECIGVIPPGEEYGFIYLGFYVTFNTVQVISQWVVGRAEETSTYSWSRFCTVKC